MPGIYDWFLNSLKVDQSPATNQLPTPIPSQNLTGLPVPFQNMNSESASTNPFTKLANLFTNANANPTVTQDTGTNPTAPNDPLKTFMLQNYMSGFSGNGNKPATSPVAPVTPVRVGNQTSPNFNPVPSTPVTGTSSALSPRAQMLMKMLMEQPQGGY